MRRVFGHWIEAFGVWGLRLTVLGLGALCLRCRALGLAFRQSRKPGDALLRLGLEVWGY